MPFQSGPEGGLVDCETRRPDHHEVINVPNWPSSTDHISVSLRDWSQEDDTFPWRG